MKKFGIKILIFVAIMGIPFGILNHLYKNTNYWKNANEVYECKIYPEGISLLNVGNSHEMAGIRYSKFYKGTSNNFATSSQPFYYSYQVLKNAEKSIADNAVVLIPISYFDWYYDWRNLFKEIKTYNNRYYSFLKPWQMYDFQLETYIECGIFPLLTAKENIKYIFEDTQPGDIEAEDTRVVENMPGTAQWKYDSWVNDVMELGENKDAVFQENQKDLTEMIDYCYEKGYTPVLLCSPMPQEFTNKFSKEFMEDFDKKNQQICERYPDMLFLDYSRDERFSNYINYFKDADHLNSAGGDAYTKQILSDLVRHGILQEDLVIN